MCWQKCGFSWSLRRMTVRYMFHHLNRRNDLTEWLWEETPFPADMPSWKQILTKLKEIIK